MVAEGDYVIAHGRFSGNGRPCAWIAADVIRFEDGKLAEHWDVLQDEAMCADESMVKFLSDQYALHDDS
jgi:predicted SnoaL-like aldol condensation-catalyzing enzyme